MKKQFIKLITEVNKDGEIEKEKVYVTGFLPFDLLEDVEKAVEVSESSGMDGINEMLKVVCKMYNNQFTTEELKKGLHAPDAMEILQAQIQFISEGKITEENQAKLKEILK